MKKSFTRGDIVLIDWIDSVFDRGWQTDSDVDKESKEHGQAINHRTVGFFFVATKDFITVSQSVSNNSGYFARTTAERISIPLVAIKKIKKL